MCLRRPSWLEKKGSESFVTVAGESYLLYVLRKPCSVKTLGQKKSWPDVNATVVTDRMLFDNAILQRSRWSSPEKWFSSQILFSSLFFRKLEFAFEGKIVLTHYKYNRWLVSLGNMNSVVSVHIISFDPKIKKTIHCILFKWFNRGP